MLRSLLTFLLALLLSLLAMLSLWVWGMPFGVQEEWEWGRVPLADQKDFLLSGAMMFLMGGVYAWFVWKGAGRVDSASRLSLACWLAGLVMAGFSWLFAVQLCPPEGYGIEKSAYVLYYQASSGYFTEARTREESLREYLANYETDIQSEDLKRRVLHHGTHPPGLFIFFRGLIRLCDSSPELVNIVLATQPASTQAMFNDIAVRNPLREADRAVIWLAALITQLSGALVVVPLFFLGRWNASARSAWIAAAFWPLIPALAIFLPKSDVLYAFLGTLFVAVWWSGWQRKSWLRTFLAGVIFWFCLMFSLALLPVAFLAGVMVLWDVLFSEEDRNKTGNGDGTPIKPLVPLTLTLSPQGRGDQPAGRMKASWPRLFSGLMGFLLPAVLVSGLTRMNLFAVWRQNYQNHAEFYRHFQRSYWAWFWANPIETLFAVGVPVCVLAAAAIYRHWKDRRISPMSSWAPDVAFLAMMAVLWISGKNRGEAARLWLVVFPYFVWISARFWDKSEDETTAPAARRWLVLSLLALQMMISCLTVLRVHGFPL